MATIKCKSCGAVQEVNNEGFSLSAKGKIGNIDDTEKFKCDFCGSAIELQQSKDFYREISKSEFGNFLMMAETAEEATNYEEATKYYNKILEKDTSYSDAWLGKGNCMIYSSTIGNIKMKEALTYWKNSIKFAEHQEPMKLRVGKEINNVVNTFFPTLLNHYYEFSSLDDSYAELAGRFLILEEAIDYATQLCPNEPVFFQTGFDLCELVIKAPSASTTTAQYAAAGSMIFNTLAGNKYSAKSDQNDWAKANERKKQIQNFGNKIQLVANKYLNGLIRLGINSESDRPISLNIKPIDEKKYKEYKTELNISYAILIVIGLIVIQIEKIGAPSMFIVFILWLLYYFFSFNIRSKKDLGMTYFEAEKIFKNQK